MADVIKPGTPGTAAPCSRFLPFPLRRLARMIVLRAALRGHLSWCTALPLLATINAQRG